MGYGLGVALLVIGLILALAVNVSLAGLDIQVVGWILVIGGLAVIALTAVQLNTRRRQTTVATTTDSQGRQATTERHTESDPPPPPAISDAQPPLPGSDSWISGPAACADSLARLPLRVTLQHSHTRTPAV